MVKPLNDKKETQDQNDSGKIHGHGKFHKACVSKHATQAQEYKTHGPFFEVHRIFGNHPVKQEGKKDIRKAAPES